jgi:hypothetical protein
MHDFDLRQWELFENAATADPYLALLARHHPGPVPPLGKEEFLAVDASCRARSHAFLDRCDQAYQASPQGAAFAEVLRTGGESALICTRKGDTRVDIVVPPRTIDAADAGAYRVGQESLPELLARTRELGGAGRDPRWLELARREVVFCGRSQFYEKWAAAGGDARAPGEVNAIGLYVDEPDPMRACR